MLKLETNVTPCILLVANHSDTPLCLMCDAMLQKQKNVMQITFFMTTQARLESFQNAHKRFSLNPSMCTYNLKIHTEDLPCTLQTFQSGTQDASFCKNQNYAVLYFLFFMNYKYQYLYIVYI